MKLFIGQEVRHKDVYNGNETLEIVGIRKDTIELEGDFSGGTNSVTQKEWLSIKGLITKNKWGAWTYPDDDFFERITKNAGQRDY